MIISVSGTGATGASAVVGLLEACNIQSYKYTVEFQLLIEPDGILDLYHFLVEDTRRLSCSTAIGRFRDNIYSSRNRSIAKATNNEFYKISEDYIDSITQISWMGRSGMDPVDQQAFLDSSKFRLFNIAIRKFLRLFNPKQVWPPYKERYFSILDDIEFKAKTQDYIKKLFLVSGFDLNKPILLEQLFPTTDPLEGSEFFDDDVRSVVVERDPRDLFIHTNFFSRQNCGFMPNSGNVNDFIIYYKDLHRNRVEDSRVKYVQFEDLIFKYEDTSKELMDWLGLEECGGKSHFDPRKSINNTKMFVNYPELAKDIEIIETELSDYLYPFEEMEMQIDFKRGQCKPFTQAQSIKM